MINNGRTGGERGTAGTVMKLQQEAGRARRESGSESGRPKLIAAVLQSVKEEKSFELAREKERKASELFVPGFKGSNCDESGCSFELNS